jgi:hydroxyacylglutathione hydrolase
MSKASLQIYRLPVLRDNYIFLLHERWDNVCAVVDPALAEPVIHCLEQLHAPLVAILNTHHHHDHVGGNRELCDRFPKVVVYGSAGDRHRIPNQSVALADGDRVYLGRAELQVLFVPGHTTGHIAYYCAETGDLFCGDTLFAGGCGRLFEGTPQQMLNSLDKLRQLPDTTRVWCAHEYTLHNLSFALTVEPDNPDLQARWQAVKQMRSQGQATIPTQIGLEKATNPFLRWDQPSLQTAMGYSEPVAVFRKLRGLKDLY